MNTQRRRFLLRSGCVLGAGLTSIPWVRPSRAADVIDIVMKGTPGGARVWFRPKGLLIQPGQTVRWINQDPGNSHTATAYHPSLFGKAQRIPDHAQPWDSGFLLPGESFSVILTTPGIYDYYCLPHEHAGMVGRIIVGQPEPRGWQTREDAQNGLPAVALQAFPSVELIMKQGIVD
ncbi:plastocyanin/azurin family copper-binding protein [Allopusillimonas ginsengisoli]|uniref:plastocyanin/azurin family copper-binding protein n=1 Tax=Allopusillimonas ginsengisoli TaxID=453575 RepID=UPI0014312549|nr:plastocyanin/azurin family copper-binding protein [Allopusillimonas ginsengisoli]